MSKARDEAIADCKYGHSLGGLPLEFHMAIWIAGTEVTGEDIEYRNTILEIKNKLGTEECLLK